MRSEEIILTLVVVVDRNYETLGHHKEIVSFGRGEGSGKGEVDGSEVGRVSSVESADSLERLAHFVDLFVVVVQRGSRTLRLLLELGGLKDLKYPSWLMIIHFRIPRS